MELLAATKQKHLLEAGLEVLHQESLSWLNTLLFWQDESTFYKNLLHHKLSPYTHEKDRDEVNRLISGIGSNTLISFRNEVLLHEQNLKALIISLDGPNDYRQAHKELMNRFHKLEEHMKQLRIKMFGLAKQVKSEFFNGSETLHTIYDRRAVRKYKTMPVNRRQLEEIIAAGMMAPSAMNHQPLKFYIITDRDRIKRYSMAIANVAQDLLHLSFKDLGTTDDAVFHGAPAVVFITKPKNNEWAYLDLGMCAQNMMLAAKAMGYDSCPVGLAAFIDKTPFYTELQIPASEEVKLAVVIGFGNEKPPVHEKHRDNVIFLD
jgi:nitroreductase